MPKTPVPITANRITVDAIQRKQLTELFTSPGFSLLKELIASHCAESQVQAVNRQMYPENELNDQHATAALKRARAFAGTLDVLDELEAGGDKWFTVKIEYRH